MFEMTATLRYERRYPATVNSAAETQHAHRRGHRRSSAPSNVDTDPMPNMASEDFAFMLQAKPGCYLWLGAGRGEGTANLHNPRYDFNDDALRDRRELLGHARRAATRARLVRTSPPLRGGPTINADPNTRKTSR